MARTSSSVWVDEANVDKVVLRVESAPVGHSKGLVRNRVVNRTPHVDDADASLQEAFGVLAKVAVDTSNRSVERLVDVNTFL